MLRASALGIVVVVVAACATVAPASTSTPSPAPAAATATPTAPSTPTPTVPATAPPTASPTAPPTAPPAASPTPATSGVPTAELCAEGWFTSPATCGGSVGDRFQFICPAGGQATAVYGTDTYTDDSSACVAAVHAGLITFATGGSVILELTPGLDAYVASTRNGVESSSWGAWPTSFVFVGGAVDPLSALIAHIPAHLQGECGEVHSFDAGVLISTQCINIPDIEGYVVYTQFDSLENLNASYAGNRDYFGADTNAGNCQVGPSEGGYTIDGVLAGQLVCNTYTGVDPDGLILFWTNEELLIAGDISVYGGTFADLYDIWQDAGPVP